MYLNKFFIYLFIIKKFFSCENFFNICDNNHICMDYITKYKIEIIYNKIDKLPSNLKYIYNLKLINICLKHSIHLIKNYNNFDNEIFNLSLIYPDYIIKKNIIRIIHKGNKNIENKILCVFGVLENKNGYEIEKEMLDWLLPEYDVYCVYQKYPGELYEYPAIKFAQYIINYKNDIFLLYIHTKGAFYPSSYQNLIRNIWKKEFRSYNKLKYINPLKKNMADVTCIITSNSKITWFNSFFAIKKAFNSLKEIKPSKNRYNFEGLFINTTLKVKGILGKVEKPNKVIKIILNKIKKNNNIKNKFKKVKKKYKKKKKYHK
jgi:hypothetical protein